jgi:hypothetical protein
VPANAASVAIPGLAATKANYPAYPYYAPYRYYRPYYAPYY